MLGFVVSLSQLCASRNHSLRRREKAKLDLVHKRQLAALLKESREFGVSLKVGHD